MYKMNALDLVLLKILTIFIPIIERTIVNNNGKKTFNFVIGKRRWLF